MSTAVRQEALYPNHCWALDFIFDWTEDGRALKILNVVDECSRMNIALRVSRHFTADDVVLVLGQAMLEYGIPVASEATMDQSSFHTNSKPGSLRVESASCI